MKNKKNNTATLWKIVSAVLAVALVAVCCTWAFTANSGQTVTSADNTSVTEAVSQTESQNIDANALSLWTEDAPLKAELTSYMAAITDENSADFIPIENRIAVFDMERHPLL